MAYTITDVCTACGLCVDVCPIGAISVGDPIYVVDDTCCDFEECVIECPEEAIVPLEDAAPSDLSSGRAMQSSTSDG